MANPFTPAPTDAAVGYLQMIFGDVITHIVSGMSPNAAGNAPAAMLGEAFRYFNSGVLVFGTFILTWVTIFGIQNSANDGEVLGKQWNTFYTPVRTLAAASMLVPTSSGYAFIQLVLLTVVTWSIGFASNIWTSVANFSIAQSVTAAAVASIRSDPQFTANLAGAIRMGACAAGVNLGLAPLLPDTKINLQFQLVATQEKQFGGTAFNTEIFYADPNWPDSKSICGTLTLTDMYPAKMKVVALGTGATTPVGDMSIKLREGIAKARDEYFVSFARDMVPQAVDQIQAVSLYTSPDTLSAANLANLLETAKSDFGKQLEDSVRQTVQANQNDFVSGMTSQGWIYAASYWTNLARIKDVVKDATASKIVFNSGTNSLESMLPPGVVLAAANLKMSLVQSVADKLTRAALAIPAQTGVNPDVCNPSPPSVQTEFTLNDFANGAGPVKGILDKWFNRMGTSIIGGMVCYLGSPDEDPVMKVKSLGDWIATFAETVFVMKAKIYAGLRGLGEMASTSLVPGTSPLAGVIKAAAVLMAELWAIVKPSLWLLLYIGYFLGIWIPMVPYYVFAVGVVGWFVFIIEMMAAGVLWAAAHTTPARDNSFIGSQMQGYMLVMSGFFRPALMVVGLVASNAVLYPALSFVNGSFMARVQALQQDTVTGPLSIAGYLLVYTFIVSAVFMLVFGLPQTLPDRILRWVGAGVGDLGEQGTMHKIEGSASSQARTAMLAGGSKQAALQAEERKKAEEEARRAFNSSNEGAGAGNADMPATETGHGPIRI